MKTNLKKLASQYVKIVEWSEEDQCYIGTCPELFHGGTHGSSETKVYAALCEIVADVLAGLETKKKKLPVPRIPQKFSGKFVLRTGPELHKALSIRAFREKKSLNQVCLEAIQPHANTFPGKPAGSRQKGSRPA